MTGYNHPTARLLCAGYTEELIAYCHPYSCITSARPFTEGLMMSRTRRCQCTQDSDDEYEKTNTFSPPPLSTLEAWLTGEESRGHGVDAQPPAAHFYPSLVRHVGCGVVLGIRISLVNNLQKRGWIFFFFFNGIVRRWSVASGREAAEECCEPRWLNEELVWCLSTASISIYEEVCQ